MSKDVFASFRRMRTALREIQIGDALVALVFLDALLILWASIQVFYLHVPANVYITWPAEDYPSIQPEDLSAFAIGTHYFGDFLQPFLWSHYGNPWTFYPNHLANYPPIAIWVLKPLAFLPYKASISLYLGSMIISTVVAAFVAGRAMPFVSRVSLSITFGILAVPFLMSFDRGNLVGFFGLLFAILILALETEKKWLAAFVVGVMACVKVYPVLLLLLFMRRGWWKVFAITAAASLALTLGLFALAPGGFSETVQAFITANTNGNASHLQSALDTYKRAVLAIVEINPDYAQVWAARMDKALLIARVLLLVLSLAVFVAIRTLRPVEQVMVAAFAMSTIYSVQISYNWIWILPVAVGAIAMLSSKPRSRRHPRAFVRRNFELLFAIVGFTVMAMPFGLHFPGGTSTFVPHLGICIGIVVTASYLVRFTGRRVREITRARSGSR